MSVNFWLNLRLLRATSLKREVGESFFNSFIWKLTLFVLTLSTSTYFNHLQYCYVCATSEAELNQNSWVRTPCSVIISVHITISVIWRILTHSEFDWNSLFSACLTDRTQMSGSKRFLLVTIWFWKFFFSSRVRLLNGPAIFLEKSAQARSFIVARGQQKLRHKCYSVRHEPIHNFARPI